MADTPKPNQRPEQERRNMTDTDRADRPVTPGERAREHNPPHRPDHPEPSKQPGLDGDVFGR